MNVWPSPWKFCGRWGLEGSIQSRKSELLVTASAETAKSLGEAHASFRVLLTVVGCDAPASLSGTGFLLETVRIIESAPFDRLHLRLPAFENENTKKVLETRIAKPKL